MRAPGFTLIELVVVMVVLGILASVGLQLDWSSTLIDSRRDSLGTEVQAFLENSRDSAIRTRRLYRVRVNNNKKLLVLYIGRRNTPYSWAWSTKFEFPDTATALLSDFGNNQVVFGPDGSTFGGVWADVALESSLPRFKEEKKILIVMSQGSNILITISHLTGYIKVEETNESTLHVVVI